jgi:methionyl-tRNA formyltransferase
MRMDPGIDTGPILSQKAIPILSNDTAVSLSGRLAELGAGLLVETLAGYLSGKILPRPQEEISKEPPTYAPMLKKEDGLLDFSQAAVQLERQVRAYAPWPGAYTLWQGQNLKINKARVVEQPNPSTSVEPLPGKEMVYLGLPAITTCKGLFVIEELQPAGKKTMSGKVFINGSRTWGK